MGHHRVCFCGAQTAETIPCEGGRLALSFVFSRTFRRCTDSHKSTLQGSVELRTIFSIRFFLLGEIEILLYYLYLENVSHCSEISYSSISLPNCLLRGCLLLNLLQLTSSRLLIYLQGLQ